jgi:hypothetical protein
MTELVIRLVYAAAGVLAGLLVMINHQPLPTCMQPGGAPSKDSCQVDYLPAEHRYVILPDTP